MKNKVQAKKLLGQDFKPAALAVRVRDKKLLALRKLIQQRKCVTRKIKQLPKLEPRLRIENPGLSLRQLVARLDKKKATIDKAMAKYNGMSSPKSPDRQLPRYNSIHRSEVQFKTILEAMDGMTGRLHIDWRDYLQESTCPTINGRAMPYLTRIGATEPEINDLNHDSTSDYEVDQQSYFMGSLGYLIGTWLNDKASCWRNDDPDSVMWYDNVCFYVPPVGYDANIVASLAIKFSGQIVSEADDHNEIRQFVYVVHSDTNGNLPPFATFGDEYDLNNIDLSGEIGLPQGNHFDSGWVTAGMSFHVKPCVGSYVALANCTQLFAQDGTLNITGTWEITDLYYSITPLLH